MRPKRAMVDEVMWADHRHNDRVQKIPLCKFPSIGVTFTDKNMTFWCSHHVQRSTIFFYVSSTLRTTVSCTGRCLCAWQSQGQNVVLQEPPNYSLSMKLDYKFYPKKSKWWYCTTFRMWVIAKSLRSRNWSGCLQKSFAPIIHLRAWPYFLRIPSQQEYFENFLPRKSEKKRKKPLFFFMRRIL